MKIQLGAVSLAVSDIASQGNAILGIRDSGKTWAAILMAEKLMAAGIPIIAFDPIGRWRHLGTPGSGKGFPIVVAGGEHGDLPLTPQSAPEIVRAAMRERVSLVLDLYSMELSKADWRRIVMASVSALLYENKNHGLRHVFIEEAAEFVPQLVNNDTAKVYDQIERLARMGGNALLGYTLINQRAEQVNKAVLELCDNLLLFRQKGKNSLTSLSKWLDIGSASQGKEIIGSLPTLPQGTCWIWAAGTDHPVRVKMPGIQTFSPDRRAQHAAGGAVPARVDVGKFVEGMKGALEKVIAEAAENDPKALRAEIAKLKRDIAAGTAAGIVGKADPAALEAEWRSGFDAGVESGRLLGERAGNVGGFANALEAVKQAVGAIQVPDMPLIQGMPKIPDRAFAPASMPRVPVRNARPAPLPKPTPNYAHGDAPTDKPMAKMERTILSVLAQYQRGLSTRQIEIHTTHTLSGGSGASALARMRAAAWIETGADRVNRITDLGLAALGHYDPLPTGRALLEHWLGKLGKMEATLLSEVCDVYPAGLTTAELAERTGHVLSGGSGASALAKLRGLGLVSGKPIVASAELF